MNGHLESFVPKSVSLPGESTKLQAPTDVQIAQELVKIPSFETEERIGHWIAEFVRDFGPSGFDTLRLPVGVEGRDSILIANDPQPDFIILSHIDTVAPWIQGNEQGKGQYDPFGATIDNGKLYGRGASDQKGSAASILRALSEYKGKENQLPKIMIAFTSMEEDDLQGAFAVADYFRNQSRIDPNYHPKFVLETGADRQIGWQCRGCVAIGGEFRGVSGHAAVRTPGTKEPINAFEQGSAALFSTKDKIYNSGETGLGRTTMNIASGEYGLLKIDGSGSQVIGRKSDNRIPDAYRFRVEFRPNGGLFNGEVVNGSTLKKLITEEATIRGLSVPQIEVGLDVAGWAGDRKDTAWIEEIARDVLKIDKIDTWNAHEHGLCETPIILSGATQDGKHKVGAAIFGTADSTQFHAVDESVGVDELASQTEIYSRAVREFREI